jgi:hypothetical protein
MSDIRVNNGDDEGPFLRTITMPLRRDGWVMEDHYDENGVYQFSRWRPPLRLFLKEGDDDRQG